MTSYILWIALAACTGRSEPGDLLPPRPTVSTGMVACAVDSAGTLRCWGDAAWVGDTGYYGERLLSDTPEGRFHTVAVASDSRAICAIHTNGQMSCWGHENPVPSSGGPWKQVGLGPLGGCAVRLDGRATCWSRDLGEWQVDGSWRAMVGTVLREGPPPYELLACGVTLDGEPRCFGSRQPDLSGLLGRTWDSLAVSRTLRVCGLSGEDLHCGGFGSYEDSMVSWVSRTVGMAPCGVRTDGRTTCWHYDGPDWRAQPEGIEGPWVDVSTGYPGTCALRPDDTVACWGVFGDEVGIVREIPDELR